VQSEQGLTQFVVVFFLEENEQNVDDIRLLHRCILIGANTVL
jgi:hypothetical protein